MDFSSRDCWIFDMDGTLTIEAHDFAAICQELGIPGNKNILEGIAEMPEAEAAQCRKKLEQIELDIAQHSQAQPGAVELLSQLQQQNKRIAILTRNSKTVADRTLAACGLDVFFDSNVILSRDCCTPKPSPDGIHHLLKNWNSTPQQAVMVGDYVFDLLSGRNAGTATVHLDVNGVFAWPEHADLCVTHLDELAATIG
jgi:HAD superfamily hydrolase (TIGR01509 family)